MKSLVIGGTGPTGHHIVNGLRERGHAVTILHRGHHEIPEIPEDVVHLHGAPYDADALRETLGNRDFDCCVATYGRRRAVAEVMAKRCGRFVSVGGVPAYRGFMNPGLFRPAGLPVPIREDAERVEPVGHHALRRARFDVEVGGLHPEDEVGLVALLGEEEFALESFPSGDDDLDVGLGDLAMIWLGATAALILLCWRWASLLTVTLNADLAAARGINARREQQILIVADEPLDPLRSGEKWDSVSR